MEKFENCNITYNTDNLTIKADKDLYNNSFYFEDFLDDHNFSRLIKSIEREIRSSIEYNMYLSLLKSNCPILTSDNIQNNISDDFTDIEMHHYPLTLADIVESVLIHRELNKIKITSFSVAKEIMELHFKNKIGLVPLSVTNHELAHNGALFISKKQIFGDWEYFLKEYADGISGIIKENIKKLEEYSESHISSDFNGIYTYD